MRMAEHPTLIRRQLDNRLQRLHSTQPILAATLVEFQRRCGVPSCHCMREGPAHPSQHVTFKEKGRSRSVYVPQELLPQVRAWIEEHRRLQQLLHEISQLSLALIRTHVRQRRRKKGRP